MLALAVFGLLARMPADGGRIEQNLRSGERSQSRRFGIPFIPADAYAGAGVMSVERFEPQVAGREIELFVIERVVGYVHLAVDAGQMSVGVNYHGGVVVKPRGAALEQRSDDHDAMRGRQLCKRLGARPWNWFGQIEVRVIFGLAEIARAEQLLGRNHVRALTRGLFNTRKALVQILARIIAAAHLNQRHIGFIPIGLIRFHVCNYIASCPASTRYATLRASNRAHQILFQRWGQTAFGAPARWG